MVLQLTFQRLNVEERKRWLSLLAGTSTGAAEGELALRYHDGAAVVRKKRGQYPERVRLVKYDASCKSASDEVMLWDNQLTLVIQDGSISFKEDAGVRAPDKFFRVVEDRGTVCIEFKLTTNAMLRAESNATPNA